MPRSRRDKTTGLPIPDPVVPASSVCFSIQVPNAIEYRSALKGALASLAHAWTWAQTEGSDNAASFQAAELWQQRLYEAFYSLDCGAEPMSCEDVANCIETSPGVQAAIADQIASNSNAPGPVYNTTIYGVPMSDAQAAEPITSAPGCDDDILFGSVTEILDQLDKNNLDFLQVLEAATNSRERISAVIAAIPLIETLPIDDAITYIDKLENEILENYEAQWTTALRDEYRCGLWCFAREKPECELTFDDLVGYWENRLGTALEPGNFFASALQYFLLGTWSGSTVVDIMMLMQLGTWRQASTWSGVSLRTLQTVGLLGANNPDHDWSIIPCGCVEPPDDGCYDLTAAAHGWYGSDSGGNPNAGFGSWILGQGLVPGPGNTAFFARNLEPSRLVSEVTITTSIPTAEIWLGRVGSGGLVSNDGTQTTHVFNNTTHSGFFPRDMGFQPWITFPGNIAPGGARITQICMTDV